MKTTLLIAISTLMLATACTRVPLTNRKQIKGIYSSEDVIQMGADAYKQVLDSVALSTDEEAVAQVKRVGNKIKDAVEKYLLDNDYSEALEGFDWQFNLIDNDTLVNAWAMPGGKVAFYTGILPVCQDELGLAVVMGHEVAHAIAKHGQERMNQGSWAAGIFGVAGAAAGGDPSAATKAIFQVAGLGTNIGMLSFSRKHESEADELGLTFMAIAGYDPREAPIFWERMSAGGGNEPPEFLSTHPSHKTRIKRLNNAMPKALEFYTEK